MHLIMGPVVKSINRKYKLQVRFQDGSVEPTATGNNNSGGRQDPRPQSPVQPVEPAKKPRNQVFIPQ
jgi:hypothetical protein